MKTFFAVLFAILAAAAVLGIIGKFVRFENAKDRSAALWADINKAETQFLDDETGDPMSRLQASGKIADMRDQVAEGFISLLEHKPFGIPLSRAESHSLETLKKYQAERMKNKREAKEEAAKQEQELKERYAKEEAEREEWDRMSKAESWKKARELDQYSAKPAPLAPSSDTSPPLRSSHIVGVDPTPVPGSIPSSDGMGNNLSARASPPQKMDAAIFPAGATLQERKAIIQARFAKAREKTGRAQNEQRQRFLQERVDPMGPANSQYRSSQ